MREAYGISVYRRNGRFYVSPCVGSTLGLENLPGIISVAGRDDLLRALDEARAQIEAAWARPRAERIPPGALFYLAAGASSWSDFVRGTVEVAIRYLTTATEIRVLVPDPKLKRLEASSATPSSKHPFDLPLADAIPIVLGLFERYPE